MSEIDCSDSLEPRPSGAILILTDDVLVQSCDSCQLLTPFPPETVMITLPWMLGSLASHSPASVNSDIFTEPSCFRSA